MKVFPVSDLHLDFQAWHPELIPGSFDVLAVAGDIGHLSTAALFFADFIGKYKVPVVVVLGNHEYYDKIYQDTILQWKELEKDPRMHGRLHVLVNESVEIEGKRFVGTTLWTRIPPSRFNLMIQHMADFKYISYAHPDGGSVQLTPSLTSELFEENINFLENELQEGDYLITHHGVSEQSIHPRYDGMLENCGWVTDLEDFILRKRPAIVHHGHVHSNFSYSIGDTRVICNPRGYIKWSGFPENPYFREDLVVYF